MVECLLGATWKAGPIWCCNSLSLGQVELEGLTGHIEFNSKGQRSNYALKILQFTRNGFRQVSLAMPLWWQIRPPCSFLYPQPISPWHSGWPPALSCPQEQQAVSSARLLASPGFPLPAPGSASVGQGPQPQQNAKREAAVLYVGRGETREHRIRREFPGLSTLWIILLPESRPNPGTRVRFQVACPSRTDRIPSG